MWTYKKRMHINLYPGASQTRRKDYIMTEIFASFNLVSNFGFLHQEDTIKNWIVLIFNFLQVPQFIQTKKKENNFFVINVELLRK